MQPLIYAFIGFFGREWGPLTAVRGARDRADHRRLRIVRPADGLRPDQGIGQGLSVTLRVRLIIIVGGGSAGCVLANRLSARSARARAADRGRTRPAARRRNRPRSSTCIPAAPRSIRQSLARHRGAFPARQPQRAASGRRCAHYEQARVIGGGSSINGQVANRGTPADYDEWAALGADGWGWADVLPYFRRLETRSRFRRAAARQSRARSRSTASRASDGRGFRSQRPRRVGGAGFADIADQNGRFEDG